MSGIIDFHSHILPRIDDGSKSVEMSIEMLKREADQGITHVVATPHFYAGHDYPQQFLERRNASEARLREAMAKHSGLPSLSIGAEVHFFSGMSDSEWLTGLTIDQKKCILIEMPDVPWTEKNYQELVNIREKCGMIPIIAHVDRYITPLRKHGIPERLAELPVLVQANASFFLNFRTRHMALRMLQNEQIHLLGSDCHNLTDRAPCLGAAVSAIRERLGEEPLEQLRNYQTLLLANDT